MALNTSSPPLIFDAQGRTAINNTPSTPSPLDYELYNAKTVFDIWTEWTEGIKGWKGGLVLRDLEEEWGVQWRSSQRERTAWYRRKAVIDEIRRLQALGEPIEAILKSLEAQRAGRSIRSLINDLNKVQRYQEGKEES